MSLEPTVLRRLKELGLDQKTIAQALGASPASVSAWCNGKTPFEEPWHTEATILLAVLREHVAHGGTLTTFRRSPHLELHLVAAQPLGDFHLSPTQAVGFLQGQEALLRLPCDAQQLANAARMVKVTGENLGTWAERIDPLTWHPTARELDEMRRTVDFLRSALTYICLRI